MSEGAPTSAAPTTPAPATHFARPQPALSVVILAAADLLAVTAAAAAAYGLRVHFLGPWRMPSHVLVILSLCLFPASYALAGLYPGYGLTAVQRLRRQSRSTTGVMVLLSVATLLLKGAGEISRLVLVTTWLLALVMVPLVHGCVRALLHRAPWWGQPVLILGAARTGELVGRALQQHGLGLRPVAYLDDDPHRQGDSCAGLPVLGPLSEAPALAVRHGIRTAVLAMPGVGRQRLLALVDQLAAVFPRLVVIPDLFGVNTLWVNLLDLQGVLGIELRQNLLLPWNRWLKRIMDLTLGLPLLLLAAPVIGLAGLSVKLLSPGPAFYCQLREGLGGRTIRIWKIRTMVPDAEAALERYLDSNPAARQEWEQYMKLRHDPRLVPRIGHLLRRFSIDELPQLWNVVRGEMSLVGPRPFPHYHLERFPERFRNLRRRVPPGITGLWQVSARSEADLKQQEDLDTYYVRNWSPWLDIYLLARTVTAVLSSKGAY